MSVPSGSNSPQCMDLVQQARPIHVFHRTQGILPEDFPFLRSGSNILRISSEKAHNVGWEARPFRDTGFDELEFVTHVPYYSLHDMLPPDKQEEVSRLWRKRVH